MNDLAHVGLVCVVEGTTKQTNKEKWRNEERKEDGGEKAECGEWEGRSGGGSTDAHAKGHGGDDHLDLVRDELLVHLIADGGTQIGVVHLRAYAHRLHQRSCTRGPSPISHRTHAHAGEAVPICSVSLMVKQ